MIMKTHTTHLKEEPPAEGLYEGAGRLGTLCFCLLPTATLVGRNDWFPFPATVCRLLGGKSPSTGCLIATNCD